MMKPFPLLAALPLIMAAAPAPEPPKTYPAPSEIVAAAPAADWVGIAPADLMVMDLAADAKGKSRRVVIQLIPAPFSQGWVSNIRKLVSARWYDGVSVNRVQDNYVVQWGDASETKPLPADLVTVGEGEYETAMGKRLIDDPIIHGYDLQPHITILDSSKFKREFNSALATAFSNGWPIAVQRTTAAPPITIPASKKGEMPSFAADELANVGFWDLQRAKIWPIHCYGMVGVGRGMSPDTGSGAELYTVIGHAPRHLDRNIALVGRVIEGIEHLSSLPRGTGALGFYESAGERVPILSVRMGNEVAGLPSYQYLSTESASFAAYADARANRQDPFFITPAGGADICNIPVPVRRAK